MEIALFVLVLLIGLSVEWKLGQLTRIGYAINDKLKALLELEKKKEENAERPTPNAQRPTSEAAKPPPMSVTVPKAKEEPRVYRID